MKFIPAFLSYLNPRKVIHEREFVDKNKNEQEKAIKWENEVEVC